MSLGTRARAVTGLVTSEILSNDVCLVACNWKGKRMNLDGIVELLQIFLASGLLTSEKLICLLLCK